MVRCVPSFGVSNQAGAPLANEWRGTYDYVSMCSRKNTRRDCVLASHPVLAVDVLSLARVTAEFVDG